MYQDDNDIFETFCTSMKSKMVLKMPEQLLQKQLIFFNFLSIGLLLQTIV